jgi:hypothetical protein
MISRDEARPGRSSHRRGIGAVAASTVNSMAWRVSSPAGIQFLKSNSTDNYLRAIDPRRGTIAVAYLWPTYLDFTPYALQLAPGLASMPEAQPRDSNVPYQRQPPVS